jgi:hypothetical protein
VPGNWRVRSRLADPRQLTLTIAVPSSASTGERYGVVLAELPPTATPA